MSRYTPQDAANAAAATQAHMRQQQAQAQASNGTSASIHSGQTNNTNSSSSSSSNRYNGSSGSASNSGSGSGANTALLSGIVMGNANGAGASASVPSATRDVLSGGIGAEYGPYSHIRGGSSSAASPRGTTATYRNAAGGGGPFRGAAAGNNGGGSSGETGSGGSSGSIASSHHSSSGLLGAEYTNKSLAGPHSGGGAYSRGAAGATAGPGAGFDKRSSAHSTAYSDANSSSQQQGRYLAPAGAGASGLLWDGKDPEVDDYLHNPDPKRDLKADRSCAVWSTRGILNVAALTVLVCGLLTLFAGYPIISHYVHTSAGTLGGFNLGGTNGTGQVALIPGLRNLIDPDTTADVKTFNSLTVNQQYDLVFSDEFNTPGRTFWPGDDPFWEAVDIWYGATGDYEWYSPEAINTTDDGALTIVMTEKETHNLNFQSGMLQSWNKFCFSGGYIEMSAMLPGRQDTRGFWPGLWTMGNLARPGYLGSTEGMWPYSYDSCDWGALANQTSPDGTRPDASLNANGPYSSTYGGRLSYLPGMRTGACTCAGEDHPGPNNRVGRSAPEIDILEAQNTQGVGEASQSLQTAPYDADYEWDESVAQFFGTAKANSYTGSVYQEAVSGVADIPAAGYIGATNARYVTYGFEYEPDFAKNGGGFITWYIDGKKTWTVRGNSIPARPAQNMGRRLIPVEPMSIIMNLGISDGFQKVHFDELTFPAVMKIDYVRVYQKAGEDPKTTCDPSDYPTAQYIENHPDVYMNPNYTIFPREKYAWPKTTLVDGCSQ